MSTPRGFLRRSARRVDEVAFRRRVRRAEAAADPVEAEHLGARMVGTETLPVGSWAATAPSVSVVGQLHAPRSDWARRAAETGELVAVRSFTDPMRGTIVVQVMTSPDRRDAAAAVADVPDAAVARADETVAMSRTLPPPTVALADGALAHELLLVGRVLWLTVAAHQGAVWVAVRSAGQRGTFTVEGLSAVAAAQLALLA